LVPYTTLFRSGGGQGCTFQGFGDDGVRVLGSTGEVPVGAEDLIAYPLAWVERLVRVLEHVLNTSTLLGGASIAAGGLLLTVEEYLPGELVVQTHDGA